MHLKLSLFWVVLLWTTGHAAFGQELSKGQLKPEEYHLWGTMYAENMSLKGQWVSYTMNYDAHPDTLYVAATNAKTIHAFPEAYKGSFYGESHFACLNPGNKFTLTNLKNGHRTIYDGVQSYVFSKNSLILLCKANGRSRLDIRHLKTGQLQTVADVEQYVLDAGGRHLLYATSTGAILYRDIENPTTETLLLEISDQALVRMLWNKTGTAAAYLAKFREPQGTAPSYHLYYYNLADGKLREFDIKQMPNWPHDLNLATEAVNKLEISDDGQRVFFPTVTTQTKSDVVQLWNADDNWVLPDREKNGNHQTAAVWWPLQDRWRSVTDRQHSSYFLAGGQRYAVSCRLDEKKKQAEQFADATWYITDLETGGTQLLIENISTNRAFINPSPGGKYITYFKDKECYRYNIAARIHENVTAKLPRDKAYNNHIYDVTAKSFGVVGWTAGDRSLLVYDQYDIWEITEGKAAVRRTKGRENNQVFRSAFSNPMGKNPLPESGVPLSVRSSDFEYSGYYWLGANSAPEMLVYQKGKAEGLIKAPQAAVFVCSLQRYDRPPALMSVAAKKKPWLLVQSNKHHFNYHWGFSELLSYHNANGTRSQAALLYPANYDPNKKYPMIVHIYESMSYELHGYVNPSFRNDIGVNYANLNAQGYFVLLPDLSYEKDDVAASAAASAVAASRAAVSHAGIDETRIGLSGHSFGGYETAAIMTQTNYFRAAVAGSAPTNTTSAYLTVGVNIGRPETFRYESSQWRMSKNLFEGIEAYDRNSPVRHAHKIATPLLLWSGDQDEQVFWKQGLELHLALRRLDKPNIFLVYPGGKHGLVTESQQRDLTLKYEQWWAHYLKNDKAADWMKAID